MEVQLGPYIFRAGQTAVDAVGVREQRTQNHLQQDIVDPSDGAELLERGGQPKALPAIDFREQLTQRHVADYDGARMARLMQGRQDARRRITDNQRIAYGSEQGCLIPLPIRILPNTKMFDSLCLEFVRPDLKARAVQTATRQPQRLSAAAGREGDLQGIKVIKRL